MNLAEAFKARLEQHRERLEALAGEGLRLSRPESREEPPRNKFSLKGRNSGIVVVHFSLTPVGEYGGTVVMHWLEVDENYRNRGIGTLLHRMWSEAVKDARYNVLLATTRADNDHEIHLLQKEGGWRRLDEFTNRMTGNDVLVWSKRVD